MAFKKRQIRRTCLRTSFFDTNFKEFDPGSGRTLAARLTHASRTRKASALSFHSERESVKGWEASDYAIQRKTDTKPSEGRVQGLF